MTEVFSDSSNAKMATRTRFTPILLSYKLVVLIVCFIATPSVAAPLMPHQDPLLDYGPRFDLESVHIIKPTTCRIEKESGFILNTNTPTIAHCGDHDITISGISRTRKARDFEETTHVLVDLVSQTKSLRVILRLQDFPAEFVDTVEFTDLNGDGIDDFILNLSAHGNGLSAELGGTLYLLSTTNGYLYLALANVVKSVSNYVHFGTIQQSVLILQRLVQDKNGLHSIRAKDGKLHTFFVFDLLQFNAGARQGANLKSNLDKRFPFWTLFTNQPSHEKTTLLTPVQKNEYWCDPLRHAGYGRLIEH